MWSAGTGPRGGPARVVVVDDAEAIRRLVRRVLREHEDFAVVGEAADGLAALDLAACLQPEVVVLDQDMPRLDGVQAAARLRAVCPGLVIVLCAGVLGPGARRAAVEAGVQACLEKTDLSLLPALLHRLLDRPAA